MGAAATRLPNPTGARRSCALHDRHAARVSCPDAPPVNHVSSLLLHLLVVLERLAWLGYDDYDAGPQCMASAPLGVEICCSRGRDETSAASGNSTKQV